MAALFHRISILMLLLAFGGCLSACGSWNYEAPKAPLAVAPVEYVVGPDDVLQVTIYGEEELTREYTVGSNGQIDLALAGPVSVAGHSTGALPAIIAAAYQDGYLSDPKVSVEVKQARAFYVLGEVNTPGSYSWQPNLTVVNAAALAGGFTYRANQNSFEIIRQGQILQSDAQLSTPLMPGDVLRVKERIF